MKPVNIFKLFQLSRGNSNMIFNFERGLNSTSVVIGPDCTGSCKSNYYTITTATTPYTKYDILSCIHYICCTIKLFLLLLMTNNPRSWRGVPDTTLCDKFVSDMRQVSGFLEVRWFPLPIRLTAMIYMKYC
jgi:hypothetical protein